MSKIYHWNGIVKCTQSSSISFTEGKIYQIVEGYLNDNHDSTYGKYYDIDQLNDELASQFIEIAYVGDVPEPKLYEDYLTKKYNGILSQINTVLDDLQKISVEISTFSEGGNPLKLPFYQFDEDEIITLKALWLNGYEYIIRDKDDGLWAYDGKPTQYDDFYDHSKDTDYSVSLNDDFFKHVTFGNMLDIEIELSKIN